MATASIVTADALLQMLPMYPSNVLVMVRCCLLTLLLACHVSKPDLAYSHGKQAAM